MSNILSNNKKYEMAWFVNTFCNFNCVYCHPGAHSKKESKVVGLYSPKKIAECFDNTGKIWNIHLTGGEPFFYPKFIELCTQLTKNHIISIDTNLSHPDLVLFTKKINPLKVSEIKCSLHIKELEELPSLVNSFIKKALLLKKRRFAISIRYVSYPPLLSRIKGDIDFFAQYGLEVKPKIFRGDYLGKLYPNSYTPKEKEFLGKYINDDKEKIILKGGLSSKGKLCSAGYLFFTMSQNGNVYRCDSAMASHGKVSMGNLFEGTFKTFDKAYNCPYETCRCPYQALKNLGTIQNSQK